MVRLKEEMKGMIAGAFAIFQFQYGSIKSVLMHLEVFNDV